MTVLAAAGLTSEQLLAFWASLTTLLVAAHGLGALARRLGQPSVVGELTAGIVLGPSLLGVVAPGIQAWLFPDDPAVQGMLAAVAWIGVVLLLVCTGFETDVRLLRRLGRASAGVTVGSLLVPLAGGAVLGWALPSTFVGELGSRSSFALFVAVALSISALPVIARVLYDLQLLRRDLGQITIAAGMVNDLVGWVLLGVVAGLATNSSAVGPALLRTVGGLAALTAITATVGRRAVDRLLRAVRERARRPGAMVGAIVAVALSAGVVTQWLGVEAVIGAFIAGILFGQSRYADRRAQEVVEQVTQGVFAPVFFATAGLSVDLSMLASPAAAWWTAVIVAAATATKFVGAYAGGRIGGLGARHSAALGVALNARGALEIVVATIGLSLAVLNARSYAAIVVMAVATSMLAGPALKAVLRGDRLDAEESQRLAREVLLADSILGTSAALLPTRGGTNSISAARVLDGVLQPGADVTLLTVHARTGDLAGRQSAAAAKALSSLISAHPVRWIDRVHGDVAAAVLAEARLGYGLVALGMSHAEHAHGMSATLQRILAHTPVPVLLLSRSPSADTIKPPLRTIVVPSLSTRAGRAAQDVAFALGAAVDARVHAIHVVATPGPGGAGAATTTGDQLLAGSAAIAASFGHRASLHRAYGTMPGRELVTHAHDTGADMIVAGVDPERADDRVFLGYDAEHLLAHAPQTVALVIMPR